VSGGVRVTEVERRAFFTPRTLAQYLARSERTVRGMLSTGKLPFYRVEGAHRIDPDRCRQIPCQPTRGESSTGGRGRRESPIKRINPSGKERWIARYTKADGSYGYAGTFDRKHSSNTTGGPAKNYQTAFSGADRGSSTRVQAPRR
jgi:excisionase family DNA binding protein